MKFLKIPLARHFSFPKKKKKDTYSLLLREKKKRVIRDEFESIKRRPVTFFWEKYKNRVFGVVLGVGVFAILATVFFFSNLFVVREITMTRKDFRVNTSGVSTLLNALEGKNIFLISSENIQESLRKKFPEIKTVSLEKTYPHSLHVTISTFPIVAKWKLHVPKENKFFLLDSEGQEFEEIILFLNAIGRVSVSEPSDEEVIFSIVEKVTKDMPEIYYGYQMISTERLNEIFDAKKMLERVTSSEITTAEFYRDAQEVHFSTSENLEFWLDFFLPFSEQVEKIQLALQEAPLFEQKLEYIDLRIPGKLIYKPKEE